MVHGTAPAQIQATSTAATMGIWAAGCKPTLVAHQLMTPGSTAQAATGIPALLQIHGAGRILTFMPAELQAHTAATPPRQALRNGPTAGMGIAILRATRTMAIVPVTVPASRTTAMVQHAQAASIAIQGQAPAPAQAALTRTAL